MIKRLLKHSKINQTYIKIGLFIRELRGKIASSIVCKIEIDFYSKIQKSNMCVKDIVQMSVLNHNNTNSLLRPPSSPPIQNEQYPKAVKTKAFLSSLVPLTLRLDSCGAKARLEIKCGNENCGDTITKEILLHCFLRYDSCCFESRYVKAKKKLNSYKIYSERLLHVIVGFPTKPEFHRENKKQEEKKMCEFHRQMKVVGFELKGLRIFDFQDKEDQYSHYHYALLPQKNQHDFFRAVNRVRANSGGKFIVKMVGYRSKNTLFKYFAKRIAGKYGDGSESFFLSDRMSVEKYVENFYNVRSLVKISRRLSCSIVPVSFKCEVCGCTRCHVFIEVVETEREKKIQTVLRGFYHT